MKMNLTLQNKGSFLTRFLLIGVFLVTLSMPTWAQEKITVSGKILDNTNEPLPGAAVLVQGSKDGTQTDINGEYVITVNSNAVLEFSFIGYKSQSVSVNGRAKINVTLEPDATMLQEVVAIGYGSQRKEDLSMAVSSVKMDDIMRSRSSDLGTVLQGRLPGVTVQKSGDPMASTSFTIRGRGSKGNDGDVNSGDGVLFVVDGVPNAPYMVEDIESITILICRYLRCFRRFFRCRSHHHQETSGRQDPRGCECFIRFRPGDQPSYIAYSSAVLRRMGKGY